MDVVSYLLGKNSAGGGGGGGSTPKSLKEYADETKKDIDGLLEYWNSTPSLRNEIESGNITLYTPSSQCPIYYIYYNESESKYRIWWLPNYCFSKNGSYLEETSIQVLSNNIINYGENGWYATSYDALRLASISSTETYYYSNMKFDTLEDLINGMKNNTIEYVSSSGRRWNLNTPIASNAIMGSKDDDPNGDVFNDIQIISHNETIIQA